MRQICCKNSVWSKKKARCKFITFSFYVWIVSEFLKQPLILRTGRLEQLHCFFRIITLALKYFGEWPIELYLRPKAWIQLFVLNGCPCCIVIWLKAHWRSSIAAHECASSVGKNKVLWQMYVNGFVKRDRVFRITIFLNFLRTLTTRFSSN